MSFARLTSWSGIAAMLGGALWMIHAVAVALKPVGCIRDECYLPGRAMRGYDDLALLFVVAVLFMAAGLAGLISRVWASSRFGRIGRSGVITSVVAISTLISSGLAQSLFFHGDLPYMPLFVIPAGLALFFGLLLTAIASLRAQVLPRWVALLLIVSVLALTGFNDQNARVLLAAPLGFAWGAVGCALWTGKLAAPVRPEFLAR